MKKSNLSLGRRLLVGLLAIMSAAAVLLPPTVAASSPNPPHLVAPPEYPFGFAQDAAGNVFVASTFPDKGIFVIPVSDGPVFGQMMSAGVPTVLTVTVGIANLVGLAFDSSGNLFVANFANIAVIAKTSTSLFGVAVVANALTTISSASQQFLGLTFDAGGNLFYSGSSASVVGVIPKSNGTIFGHAVTANTPFAFPEFPGTGWYAGLSFDASGNLFVADAFGNQSVVVFPQTSGILFGQNVTANTVATITAFGNSITTPFGLDFDASGNLLVGDMGTSNVVVLAPTAALVFGQNIPANSGTTLEVAAGYANQGVMIDASGNLYIGSYGGNGQPGGTYVLDRVLPVDPTTTTTASTETTTASTDPVAPAFTG